MKREIIVFTVLITNITFASVLPSEVRETVDMRTSEKKPHSLSSKVATNLYERGLDEDVAKQKVLKFLKNNEYMNDLMVQNILKKFDKIQMQEIVSYVGNSVLFEKNVDLSNYENLVALVQKTKNLLLDTVTLEKIKTISCENKRMQPLLNV